MDSGVFHKDVTLDKLMLELFPKVRLDEEMNDTDKSRFQKETRGM